MLTLEQMKVLLAVYEAGSFSAAARTLGKAQSGISQTVANLEIDLNKPLFVREKGGITPTAELEELLPAARQLLRRARVLEQKMQALAHDEARQLSVAVEEGLWSRELLAAVQRTAARYPHLELELLVSSTFDIAQMVAAGEVQLGILYLDQQLDPEADTAYLGQYRFISVAHPDHPLAAVATIDTPLLVQHRHLVHRSLGKKALSFSPALSENCWYCNDFQSLRQLVLQNAGWADLPEKMVQDDLAAGRLVRLNLDTEPYGNTVRVIAHRSPAHRHHKVSAELVEGVRAVFGE